MSAKKIRIGLFTSGGDCAGLNYALMAITRRAILEYGWEVVGILNGNEGLDKGEAVILGLDYPWGETIRQGGSFLGAFSRANNKFRYRGEQDAIGREKADAVRGIKELGLDALIGTGGNGSMLFWSNFATAAKIPFIGIPKTIDNDTPGTDYAIGFSSAVELCSQMIDNIFWTAKSHRRAIAVEVMGRDTGHLAMHSGVAGDADIILTPEIPYTLDGIMEKVGHVRKKEKREYFVIVVSEGAGAEKGQKLDTSKYLNSADYIAKFLDSHNILARATSLGHIQRGSIPNAEDRQLAARLGTYAVDTLASGESLAMVGTINGRLKTTSLKGMKETTKFLDPKSEIVRAARDMGIYVGEL
ncbi:MAG: ATP-dependent 6-phosphofructokinase [Rickettsiales bacterium]|jgi:6-phosphofructokinase 1|nr:ATP-dependent 6-phosphofructokinase [Rickettsiales bacterium]